MISSLFRNPETKRLPDHEIRLVFDLTQRVSRGRIVGIRLSLAGLLIYMMQQGTTICNTDNRRQSRLCGELPNREDVAITMTNNSCRRVAIINNQQLGRSYVLVN
jgi:hypothetical protein